MIFRTLSSLLLALASTVAQSETIDYKKAWTTGGDKLPDFSYAGYHHSEVALPALDKAATKILSPGSGDQTSAIQAAIDSVSKSGGGVVEFKAGTYALSSGLLIRNFTTLRGAGIGKTILTFKNLSKDVVTFGNQTSGARRAKSVAITDTYVPAGTGTVHVADASGLSENMDVFVERGVTQAWIDAMGMTPYKEWLEVSLLLD